MTSNDRVELSGVMTCYLLGWRQPFTKGGKSLLFPDCPSLLRNVVWHPLRERNLATCVATGLCVLLSNLSELFGREALGKPNQRGPKPSMNEGDLPVDQATDKDLVRLGDGFEDSVNLAPLRVRPPIALDRFADDCLNEARHNSLGRSENYAMLSHKGQRLFSG